MINIELQPNKKLNKINKMLLFAFGLGGFILIVIGCIPSSNLVLFNIISILFLLIIMYLGYLQNKELERILNENGISINSNKNILLLLHNKKNLIINEKPFFCHLEVTLNKIGIKVIK